LAYDFLKWSETVDIDSIHPKLIKDCHFIGSMPSGQLLLNRNAALHWFILVPDSTLNDVLDLPLAQAQEVFTDCVAVSAYIKHELSYPKVNFAALGNQVPQMHLHIIGRRVGDACWPDPVWGNLQYSGVYTSEKLADIQSGLVQCAGLVLPSDQVNSSL
jgi:diadenosine tetraphosphate (Ap4A) HIT family hydrolase